MMLNAPEPLGELVLSRVYFEHDGPRLFSATRLEDDQIFLANCVDEDADTIQFLYWSVSNDDLVAVERGEKTLLASLRTSPDILLAVEEYGSNPPEVRISILDNEAIPAEYLPDPDALLTDLRGRSRAALDLFEVIEPPRIATFDPIRPSDTANRFLSPYSSDVLNEAATTDGHLYLAVEISGDEASPVSLADVTSVGGTIQELIFALGNESSGYVRTNETVRNALSMAVEGAMAASFVLILRTPDQGHLVEGPVSMRALRGLTWILKAARRGDDLVEELGKRSPQVRRRVRELLSTITEAECALTAVVTDGQDVTWGTVTPDQAADSLASLTEVPPSVSTVSLNSVVLTALNLTRRTFEVWDRATGRKYSGELPEDVLPSVDGLTVSTSEQWYNAVLEIETDFAQDRTGPAQRRRLLSISPTSPNP